MVEFNPNRPGLQRNQLSKLVIGRTLPNRFHTEIMTADQPRATATRRSSKLNTYLRETRNPVLQRIDIMSIPDEEVRYYRDPMRRLVELHSGFHEIMTGLSFNSPWPRADARFR